MIAIADYGAGNIASVVNVLKKFGTDYVLATKKETLFKADGIILPGVGAFGAAEKMLKSSGLFEGLRTAARQGLPLLGICLGMQLLFSGSEESPGAEGLSLLDGVCKRLDGGGRKIPHIGWTSIGNTKGRLMEGAGGGGFFYFVHSYAVRCEEPEAVAATAEYGETFAACVEKGNVFGCQFHPEKSSSAGLKIMEAFLKICGEEIKQI